MSSLNCEYVWKFLRENKNEIDCDNNINELTCVICKGILIEPHVGLCGCKYCLSCLKDHLNGENKFCPGTNDNCQVEILDIGICGRDDDALIQKICKLIVKCPRHLCVFKTELERMESHEKECKQKCDLHVNMGCSSSPLGDEIIDKNIGGASGKLSLKHVDVLKNMVDVMKKDFIDLKQEMSELSLMKENQRKVAEEQDKKIEQLKLEMQAVREENKLIKEKRESLKLEMEKHRAEFLGLMAAIQQQITQMRAQNKSKHEKMNNWEKGID